MNGTVVVVSAVVVGGAALALTLFVRKLKTMRAGVDEVRAVFRQQVGYDYASVLTPGMPPRREKSTPAGTFSHHFEVYRQQQKRVTAQSWDLLTPAPPPVALQLFDKNLLGTLRALKNLVGPIQRTITPSLPGPVPIGTQDLDERFALFTADADGARAVLARPPVRSALLALASVCLLVDAKGASFGDPSDTNVYASGASRLEVDPAPAIRSAARVHLAVEHLLELVTAPR